MRVVIAALVLALATASARAQMANTMGSQIGGHAAHNQDKANKSNKPKVDEKAYSSALRNLPDKQYDPWRGVR